MDYLIAPKNSKNDLPKIVKEEGFPDQITRSTKPENCRKDKSSLRHDLK